MRLIPRDVKMRDADVTLRMSYIAHAQSAELCVSPNSLLHVTGLGEPNLPTLRHRPGQPNLPTLRHRTGQPNLPTLQHRSGQPNLPTLQHRSGQPNLPTLRHRSGQPNLPTLRHRPGQPNLPTLQHRSGQPNLPTLQHGSASPVPSPPLGTASWQRSPYLQKIRLPQAEHLRWKLHDPGAKILHYSPNCWGHTACVTTKGRCVRVTSHCLRHVNRHCVRLTSHYLRHAKRTLRHTDVTLRASRRFARVRLTVRAKMADFALALSPRGGTE